MFFIVLIFISIPVFGNSPLLNREKQIPNDIIAVRAILDSNRLSRVKVGDVADINKHMRVIALNLSKLKLKTIPPIIGQLQELTMLNLSRNLLTKLPDAICKLKNLTNLNLSINRLKFLPVNIGQLSRLEILNVSKNSLRKLPIDIQSLFRLEDLIVFDNNLERLPEQFGGLQSLNRFKADNNRLSNLPESFCFLTGLRHISLQHNLLSGLPECISDIPAHIALRGNNLCQLAQGPEDWIYKNSNDHNWKASQKCQQKIIDISDEELPPEAFVQSKLKIPEPPPAIQQNIASLSMEYNGASKIPPTANNLKKHSNRKTVQVSEILYQDQTSKRTQIIPSGPGNGKPRKINQFGTSGDTPTRRSNNKVENGIFEGFLIERKITNKNKQVRVSFIFSSEAFMGTTLYDYYDSTEKAIVLDFYNNILGTSVISEFSEFPISHTKISELELDLNKDVPGLKSDFRKVVRVKFFTNFTFPYEVQLDEFNTLSFEFEWNEDIKAKFAKKNKRARWMLPLSMVFTGALASGFFLFF